MQKYHYIDDQGSISDALPLAALHKIGLPPATKVLIEGGKQWITLAEVTAGEPTVISPPPPPPPVAAPSIPAKPVTIPAPPIAATSHSDQNFWKVFLSALFLGFLGVHRFMVGKTKTGILQLITFGGLGLWAFVDIVLILLGKFTDEKNQTIANPSPKDAWKVFGVVFLIGWGIYGGYLEKNGGPSGDWESTAGNKCKVTSDMITFYVDDSIALAGYYTKGGPDVEVEGNTKRINYGAFRMLSNHGPAFMGALKYEKTETMETLYFSFLDGTQAKDYTLHRK